MSFNLPVKNPNLPSLTFTGTLDFAPVGVKGIRGQGQWMPLIGAPLPHIGEVSS